MSVRPCHGLRQQCWLPLEKRWIIKLAYIHRPRNYQPTPVVFATFRVIDRAVDPGLDFGPLELWYAHLVIVIEPNETIGDHASFS